MLQQSLSVLELVRLLPRLLMHVSALEYCLGTNFCCCCRCCGCCPSRRVPLKRKGSRAGATRARVHTSQRFGGEGCRRRACPAHVRKVPLYVRAPVSFSETRTSPLRHVLLVVLAVLTSRLLLLPLALPRLAQATGLSRTRHLRVLLQGRGGDRVLPRECFVVARRGCCEYPAQLEEIDVPNSPQQALCRLFRRCGLSRGTRLRNAQLRPVTARQCVVLTLEANVSM